MLESNILMNWLNEHKNDSVITLPAGEYTGMIRLTDEFSDKLIIAERLIMIQA